MEFLSKKKNKNNHECLTYRWKSVFKEQRPDCKKHIYKPKLKKYIKQQILKANQENRGPTELFTNSDRKNRQMYKETIEKVLYFLNHVVNKF